MHDVIEVFADTGEIIERDFTPDEQSQRAKDAADFDALAQLTAQKQQADAEARKAAIDHAKSLGFTDAMIAVMYAGLAG